jgi:hypothetical protein
MKDGAQVSPKPRLVMRAAGDAVGRQPGDAVRQVLDDVEDDVLLGRGHYPMHGVRRTKMAVSVSASLSGAEVSADTP